MSVAAKAALQFQPVRRPQVQPRFNRPKQSSSSAHKFSSSTATASSPDKQLPAPSSTPQQQPPGVQRTNFNDWVGDEEEGYYYQQDRQRPERGGRKKKKKGNKQQGETRVWEWDDIYDPTLPNNYADYKGSEEQYREIRDWKARLYYHQLKEAKAQGKSGAAYSDEEDARRPAMNSMSAPSLRVSRAHEGIGMFAPPSNLNFAPPSFDDDAPVRPTPADDEDYYPHSRSKNAPETNDGYEPRPSFARAPMPDIPTGDDAYARRMQLSGQMQARPPMPPPSQQAPAPSMPAAARPPAPAPADAAKAAADLAAKKAEAAAKVAAFKAKLEANKAKNAGNAASPAPLIESGAPPTQSTLPQAAQAQPSPPPPPPPAAEEPGVTVSRAPVRYNVPPPPADPPSVSNVEDTPSAEQTRSNRPGQKGFAERLLKKYGWEKGQGLGAQGEGITTAIVAKAEKRKQKSDAQGGGWATPANMGKIVGGKKRKIEDTSQDDGAFGAMSEVVKLEGMCKGLDIDYEIVEGNLYDEIGREMEGNYGKVERLVIWRREQGGGDDVFVKFTSQLSALRAVNATDGMEFNGAPVRARFFGAEGFERGEYC